MKLSYTGFKDEDVFILTDYACEPAQDLLKKKSFYKILWSKNSGTTITIDDYKLELKKNEVIFCTPLNVMEVPIESEGLLSFVFNKEFFCIQTNDDQVSCNGFLFYGSSQPQAIQLNDKESERLDNLTQLFKEDLLIKDSLQGEMLRSLLKRLLIQSTRMAKDDLPEPKISNVHMNVIREYNVLVEKHFRELHQVNEYASLLFKSPKTLANIFPKYSERSPISVINDRILLEAKRLLMHSDKSSNEIAEELGYKDSGHFSKFFKKHEGLSPSVFKKNKIKKSQEITLGSNAPT
ncbi:helix-turn-helix domain-containing protein [bacterium]|nr:helix-turn-helix domain-containing protein [bacterium]